MYVGGGGGGWKTDHHSWVSLFCYIVLAHHITSGSSQLQVGIKKDKVCIL